NIDVPDLATGIEFYSNAIGLKLNRTLDHDVAELTGGSSIVYLLQKDSGSPVSSQLPAAGQYSQNYSRQYARHWTPVHLDIVVEDIQAAKARALAAGALCESECVEWMGSKCITFSDPFG